MPTVRIGLSGWRYADWRGRFYPPGLPQRRELEHVAAHFPAVELNGSFYSLQRPTSYVAWREQTPDAFTFAVKGPRFVTHLKRLRDVRTPLANFFASGVLALGDRLGPVLWQLPARTTFDAATTSRTARWSVRISLASATRATSGTRADVVSARMRSSSSSVGYSIVTLNRKRSSSASGSR